MFKFVILASPRTGSNLLVDILNRHPEFYCHGEIFHHQKPNGLRSESVFKDLINIDPKVLRDRSGIKFLELVHQLSPTHKNVGFKFFYNHDPEILQTVIADETYKIIHLMRDNKLASYSSIKIAEITNVWHHGYQKEKLEAILTSPKIEFNEHDFLKYIDFIQSHENNVKHMLKGRENTIDISYDTLLESLPQLSNFFHCNSTIDNYSTMEKQNPSQPINRFSNPDNVKKTMEKLKCASWL